MRQDKTVYSDTKGCARIRRFSEILRGCTRTKRYSETEGGAPRLNGIVRLRVCARTKWYSETEGICHD